MNADLLARAKALAAEGLSNRAIARVLGTTHPTIAKLLKAPAPADAATPPTPPVTADDPEPDAPPTGLPGDTLTRLREMQDRYFERAARFEAAGDFTAAGRAGRDAATLAPVIARLERDAKAGDGVFTFTMADVEAIRKDFRQKVHDTQHRGLLCADCGRRLRRAEAGGDDEPEEA